jgi:hypothetical protein
VRGARLGTGKLAAAALALAAAAALSGAAGGARLPLAPLAPLGRLLPAPAPGPLGPEGVPIPHGKLLAGVGTVRLGETVDGVTCQATEEVVYHIHAHLTIFVRGRAYVVPIGIGIGPPISGVSTPVGLFAERGSCFMWLHTHALDGVIHIESPNAHTYTLGQFFAVWGQQLSTTRVGPAKGKVTSFYDGKVWTANPAEIPLTGVAQIQLDVGSPIVAPEHIVFPLGLRGGLATTR